MVRLLKFKEAIELYRMVKDYLPEIPEIDVNSLEFTGKIVKNIRNSEHPEDYVRIVVLLTGISKYQLIRMTPSEVVSLFIEGMMENNILDLAKFFSRMNYAD